MIPVPARHLAVSGRAAATRVRAPRPGRHRPRLWRWLSLIGLAMTLPSTAWASNWPAWEQFASAYVQNDGRVVDWTTEARSISEGQAYALFFALVAQDRDRFERILTWTENNLAQGDLSEHLPAWLWGLDEHARWGVLDPNPAADANLWLAYTLLEAARLWRRSDLHDTAVALLDRIAEQEVQRAGPETVLLPGPQGFVSAAGLRLNPSYWPPFQLKYLASVQPDGPWQALLDSYLHLLPDLSPGGRVPDWFLLTEVGPRLDTESGGAGSYDAIRVYLWAGFGPDELPEAQQLRRALAPYAELVRAIGRPPERWYPDGRAPVGIAPPGFDAALVPFFAAIDAPDLAQAARQRLAQARVGDLLGVPARYYDQVLSLFGEGYDQRRFRFGPDGRLELP